MYIQFMIIEFNLLSYNRSNTKADTKVDGH